MIDLLLAWANDLANLAWAALIVAALLAPLESMGWWAGWWQGEEKQDDVIEAVAHSATPQNPASHFVVFFTGIGGASDRVDIPREAAFLTHLRERMPYAHVLDSIYPYSVDNRSLTSQRILAWYWRLVVNLRNRGFGELAGFAVNVRNMFQVLVSADDRYGAFYSQGAAHTVLLELQEHGYRLGSGVPITIIGYSGGGQMAVGAAPYLAQVLPGPVQVISLAGVLSSTPLINRIDRVTHVYSNKDPVQRLGLIFPGRWPVSFTSGWNRGRFAGRISSIELPGMKHNGPGGYFDADSHAENGRSFLDVTTDVIVDLIETPIDPIDDDSASAIPLSRAE